MDPTQFERLAKRVGEAGSRRGAVKALAATLAAPLMHGFQQQEAEAGLPIVNCKPPGKKCNRNQKCCSGRCKKGRCSCSKKGRNCWAPLEGALCCSGRCHSGKCS